jgi:hypothetical protein
MNDGKSVIVASLCLPAAMGFICTLGSYSFGSFTRSRATSEAMQSPKCVAYQTFAGYFFNPLVSASGSLPFLYCRSRNASKHKGLCLKVNNSSLHVRNKTAKKRSNHFHRENICCDLAMRHTMLFLVFHRANRSSTEENYWQHVLFAE